jgi:predicted ATPase
MITHIRIQNLRSLQDTGFIEVKPLTILLGANSSGKSTFLRSFPLFTQSVSKSLREPISWFDDAYVDFGDYDTAKSKLAPDGEGIMFSYIIQTPLCIQPRYYFFDDRSSRIDETNPYLILPDATITLSFLKDGKGTFVNRVVVSKGDLDVEFKVKERTAFVDMFVNGEPAMEESKWKWYYGSRRKLIPEFELQRKYEDRLMSLESMVDEFAYNVILKYCSKKLRHIERLMAISSDWSHNKKAFLEILQNSKLTTLQKNARTWSEDSEGFKEIYNALALLHTIKSLDAIDEEIRSMYSNCSYIAPMRAAANRFYRTQGLQVRDVDPYGKNLQEFISSLSGNREKSYRNFTEKVLGLQVMVKNNAGHQQIILKNKYGENNMTDVGFGYSQILPIITKLWHSNYRLMDDRMQGYYWRELFFNTMLIEQPELHLHPAMQARTADIMMLVLTELEEMNAKFNEMSRDKRNKHNIPISIVPPCSSSLIVETHSQAMINRIGRRIRDKQFSADKVSILMFEKNQETGKTEIKEIGYNEKGQLMNWPFGFFEPNEDEYDTFFNKQSKG